MKTALLYLALVTAGVSSSVAIGYQWARSVALADTLDAQLRASVHSAVLRDSLRVARTTVRVDSVQVDHVVTRWRTLRDSLVDTLRITDTVRVVLEAADRAVTTCTDALGRCRSALALSDRRSAADSVRIVALAAQQTMTERALARAQSRSWRHRLEGVVACGAATYGIHRLTQD